MTNHYQNSSRSGRELPPFDELSQEDVDGFMQQYFGIWRKIDLQRVQPRLAQAIFDDERVMAIVKEAYEGVQKGEPTRAEQKGLRDRLEARVGQLAEPERGISNLIQNRH